MSLGSACAALVLAASHALAGADVGGPAGRRLSLDRIAGYEPGSDVTQHSRIDLDQAEMETHLGATPPDYARATAIYTLGANSGAYAEITLAGALAAQAAKSVAVTQAGNAAATGYVKSDASGGSTTVKVTYTSTCKEGGTSSQDLSGCFTMAGGNLVAAGVDVGPPAFILNKYRTLSGFSTAAQSKMAGQEYYAVYRAYYNNGDYAHRIVADALAGTGSCSTCDAAARVEIAKKSSAYMSVWMYVIREMEDAIMDCQSNCLECNDDPVHAWDEAVAFYAGSLEGTTGSATGKLLHELADKRCANFGTCDSASTNVNTQILEQFTRGKSKILEGRCVEAIPIKRRIVDLMSVPLVQGSLRYAWKVDQPSGGSSKERAEGEAFSAAILPRVAACDAAAADVIARNLGYAVSAPMASGFKAVKNAFESTYACLGITCEDVGGLIVAGSEYEAGAEPCAAASGAAAASEEEDTPVGLIVGLIVLVVATLLACGVAAFCWTQKMKYQRLVEGVKGGKSMDAPPSTVGAIIA